MFPAWCSEFGSGGKFKSSSKRWSGATWVTLRVKPDKGRSSREGLGFWSLSHATLRVFVAVFRAVRGFFRDAAVFLALGAALAEDCNFILGCFEVRWWP